MADQNVTAERARELLDYDKETGMFLWRFSDRNRKSGEIAGYACKSRRGVVLSLDGSQYRAHRIAWLIETGSMPRGVVDHVNGDWSDNRFANLRDVDQSTNMENLREATSKSKSGVLGIQKNGSGWCSLIQVKGTRRYLGTFKTKEEAHSAYLTAKRELHSGCTI